MQNYVCVCTCVHTHIYTVFTVYEHFEDKTIQKIQIVLSQIRFFLLAKLLA